MRRLFCFALAMCLSAQTAAISSTGDLDGVPPVTLLAIHGKVKEPIDWEKWERRGERVQKIGGGILVLVQLGGWIRIFAAGL